MEKIPKSYQDLAIKAVKRYIREVLPKGTKLLPNLTDHSTHINVPERNFAFSLTLTDGHTLVVTVNPVTRNVRVTCAYEKYGTARDYRYENCLGFLYLKQ